MPLLLNIQITQAHLTCQDRLQLVELFVEHLLKGSNILHAQQPPSGIGMCHTTNKTGEVSYAHPGCGAAFASVPASTSPYLSQKDSSTS